MKNLLGYTLIELMIVISIVSILVSYGISAYGKARDRQLDQAAGEQILSVLQANQTIASIGQKDCTGKFTGQKVTIDSGANTIVAQSVCEGGEEGSTTTTIVPGITFNNSSVIIFNPLSLGINLGASQLNLTYTSVSGLVYGISLNSSGTIEYLGVQP